MYARVTTIRNKSGLHARPASDFVRAASGFRCEITIGALSKPDRVSAKSIIMLLSQALVQGTQVEIAARGEDERQAVDHLVELIESGFGEL